MKKILALFLTAAVCVCCLVSCDMFGKAEGLTYEKYENSAVFSFDNFEGKTTIKLERTNLGEGAIYYQADLEEGTLNIKYEYAGVHELAEISADDEMPINSSGGYVEGDKIEITFEANGPVSGEIIIAFTEDALKAVHKDIQLHKHTYEYETREDAHKKIYTCDCTNLEKRDFESHYDDNADGKCDECEYYVGIPHEDHNWGYDVNETSHRQIFGCGCESPESFEVHYNNDGDNYCDACGYVLSEHEHTGE